MKSLIVFFIIVFSSSTLIADGIIVLELKPGYNNVTILENFDSFSVSLLIDANPKIQSISTIENNESLGYVNIFGGIGSDFLFRSGGNYEIYSSEELKLYINN